MFFNPIFINPQKFIGQNDQANAQKSKLSYLFSDIIKNSLGVKPISKKNTNEIKTIVNSMPDSIGVMKASTVQNLITDIVNTDMLLVDIKNIVKKNTNELSSTSQEPKLKIEISVDPQQSERIVPEENVAGLIGAIVLYLNQKGIKVDASTILVNENSSSADADLEIPDVKKIADELNSILKAGKEATITISIDDKKNHIKFSRHTVIKDGLVKVETLDPIAASPNKTTNPQSEISARQFINTTAGLEKNPASDMLSDETAGKQQEDKNIISIPVQKELQNLIRISVENISQKPAEIVSAQKTFGETKTAVLEITENSPIKTFTENKSPLFGKTPGSYEFIQKVKSIDNQLLKQDSVTGKIVLDKAVIDEIKSRNFDLLNLSSSFQRMKNISEIFPKNSSDSQYGQQINPPAKATNEPVQIKEAVINQGKVSREFTYPPKEITKLLKPAVQSKHADELQQVLKDAEGHNIKIKFLSEPKVVQKSAYKVFAPKIEAPKEVTNSFQVKSVDVKLSTSKIESAAKTFDNTVRSIQNETVKPAVKSQTEPAGKLVTMELEQFKSVIKMNSIDKGLKNIIAEFENEPNAKVQISRNEAAKISTAKQTTEGIEQKGETKNTELDRQNLTVKEKNLIENTNLAKPQIKNAASTEQINKAASSENTKSNEVKFIDVDPKLKEQIVPKDSDQKVERGISSTESKVQGKESVKPATELNKEIKPVAKKKTDAYAIDKNKADVKNELDNQKSKVDGKAAHEYRHDNKSNIAQPEISEDRKIEEPAYANKNGETANRNLSDGKNENANSGLNQKHVEHTGAEPKDKTFTVNISTEENIADKTGGVKQVTSAETQNVKPDATSFSKQLPHFEKTIKVTELYSEVSKIVKGNEKQSVTLKLIPRELGNVKIVIDIVENLVQAKIEVENETAKLLIQNSMEHLKHTLTQSGIQLSSYSISLSNPQDKQFRPHNSKKKFTDRDKVTNEEEKSKPVSGKTLGYNTYEYTI